MRAKKKLGGEERERYHKKKEGEKEKRMKEIKNAGSQYRCGRVGRGSQPLNTPSNTDTYTKSFREHSFSHFLTRAHGPADRWTNGHTDRQMDKASYRVACPQLKKQGQVGQRCVLFE